MVELFPVVEPVETPHPEVEPPPEVEPVETHGNNPAPAVTDVRGAAPSTEFLPGAEAPRPPSRTTARSTDGFDQT